MGSHSSCQRISEPVYSHRRHDRHLYRDTRHQYCGQRGWSSQRLRAPVPKHLSFRTAALISCILGIVIRPWELISDPTGYIYRWLIAYSSILGAVGGILIADYHLLRKRQLNLPDLYRRQGRYWYFGGFNLCAIIALVVGIAPSVPGLLSGSCNDLRCRSGLDRDLSVRMVCKLWNSHDPLLDSYADREGRSAIYVMKRTGKQPSNLLVLISWLLFCALVGNGCSHKKMADVIPSEPTFLQQVQAVKDGLSTEIRSSERVSDREFQSLQGFRQLEVLSLPNAPLTDEVVTTLRGLTGLRQLRLESRTARRPSRKSDRGTYQTLDDQPSRFGDFFVGNRSLDSLARIEPVADRKFEPRRSGARFHRQNASVALFASDPGADYGSRTQAALLDEKA